MASRRQTRSLRRLLDLMRRRHGYAPDAARIAAEFRERGPHSARAMVVAMLHIEDQSANLHARAVAGAMSRYIDDALRETRGGGDA